MKPYKHETYSFGWTDMSAMIKTPTHTAPTHTRTLYFELINDAGNPHTNVFNQVTVHNDKIHGVRDVDTNDQRNSS